MYDPQLVVSKWWHWATVDSFSFWHSLYTYLLKSKTVSYDNLMTRIQWSYQVLKVNSNKKSVLPKYNHKNTLSNCHQIIVIMVKNCCIFFIRCNGEAKSDLCLLGEQGEKNWRYKKYLFWRKTSSSSNLFYDFFDKIFLFSSQFFKIMKIKRDR